MKIPANGFTHAGKFHADDVFATALLQILRPDIKITRGFTVPDDFDGIVYDIGFGMFDHHQEPREYRANGVPYAAFGLLWRVLGPGLVGERQARLIDENFIQPLDLNDNTGEQNSLCDAIGFFNPVWDSKEDQDACFFQAVAVAKQILEHQIDAANAVNRADEKVQQAYRNSRDGIVVLPCYLPWKNGLYKTDALFVVYPSQRGGWSAQCVTDHKTKRSKLPFPQSWAAGGHRAEERHPRHQLLPRKPLFDHRPGQGNRHCRLPSGAAQQWPHLTARRGPRPPLCIWCAVPAASCTPAGPTTPPPACGPTAAAGARATPAPTGPRALPIWSGAPTAVPPCAGKPPLKSCPRRKRSFCARRGRPPDAPLRSTARAVPVKSRPKL